MERSPKLLWGALRNYVGMGHVSSTLSLLGRRFPFQHDVERGESRAESKFYRPSSRMSISTSWSKEYLPQPNSDLLNPFSDYLAEDAKVWTMYLDLTKSKGEELMRIWNSDLDTILIFAGLFSAILTAFLIETRKSLQEDSQVITNQLLQQISEQLSSNPRPVQSSSLNSSSFVAPSPLVWVNGLWFVSLTFSLAGAFGTILAKGWVTQFIPASAGLPIVDACNRHRRFFGDDQLHLRAVIAALPITLHVAFYLFFGGLVILLFQDDPRIALVVTALIGLTMLLYLGCSMRPILNPNSPFRTPISGLLPIIPGFFLPCIIICDVMGHILFSVKTRRLKARSLLRSAEYTRLEGLLLSITRIRSKWTNGIFQTCLALYHLVLVSNPPSDELRTNVLVSLFSLARTYNLDDPVGALAGLPMTPQLQEALYNTDPIPALTRNLSEIFSVQDKNKSNGQDLAKAYLTVLLSLVQTTSSSLNWTANSLVPLLEDGGILSSWESYEPEVLELIVCIHIHVRARSGFILPADFTDCLPGVIANCTKALHRHYLVDACMVLSAMDKGTALTGLMEIKALHPILLGPDLLSTLSRMIKHPQKRIQKAVLTSMTAIGTHEIGCAALVNQNILGLLLDHIPGRDYQFQIEALHTFSVFLQHDLQDRPAMDNAESVVYEPTMLLPWIDSIFRLCFAAMLKSDQLGIQQAAISVLSLYLEHEVLRVKFLELDYVSALITMLESSQDTVIIASLKVLSGMLHYANVRSFLKKVDFNSAIAGALQQNTFQIQHSLLDIILDCLAYDNLKYSLIPNIIWTLTVLLSQVDNSMPGLQNKLFLVLYSVSCDELLCKYLITSELLQHLLNVIMDTDSNISDISHPVYDILINILNQNPGSLNFISQLQHKSVSLSISNDLVQTIIFLMTRNKYFSQVSSIGLLRHCIHYFDLRQFIAESSIIAMLNKHSISEESHIQQASLNILLSMIEYDHMQSAIATTTTINTTLVLIQNQQSVLSEPAFKLLIKCIKYDNTLILLLPDHISALLIDFLESSNQHSQRMALALIYECSKIKLSSQDKILTKCLSAQIISTIIDIFCSTNTLDIQNATKITLNQIIKNDSVGILIPKDYFITTLLYAASTSDVTFQQSALNLIHTFSRTGLENPLSNKANMDLLITMLKTCDSDAQVIILQIIFYVSQFENFLPVFMEDGIINQVLALVHPSDLSVSMASLSAIEILFSYDSLRENLDISNFIQMIVSGICFHQFELHTYIHRTFELLMRYNDIHHKVMSYDTVRLLYSSLYRNFWPLQFDHSLTNTQRSYLTRILKTIEGTDPSTFQIISQEILPLPSPPDQQIEFEHAMLHFPEDVDSEFSGHTILDDSDSSLLYVEREDHSEDHYSL